MTTPDDITPEVDPQEIKKNIFSAALSASQKPQEEPNLEPENPQEEPETEITPTPTEEPELAPETTETPSAEEEDFDLQAHAEQTVEEPEPEKEEPQDNPSIQAMRNRLSQEGKARKAAEEELALKSEELIQLQATLENLEKENKTLTASTQKVENHPTYTKAAQDLGNSIASNLDQNGVYNLVPEDSGTYSDLTHSALQITQLPFADRGEAREKLRLHIAKKLRLIDAEETDFSVDPEAEEQAKIIAKVFEAEAPKLQELMDLSKTLSEKASESALELGYSEREAKAEPLRQRIAELINLDEELIQDDPYSLVSQSSVKLKGDRALAKNIARTIEEYRFGPRVLSQDELDSLARAGKDPEEHKKAMARKVQKNNEFVDKVLMSVLPDYATIEKQMMSSAKAKAKKVEKKETEGAIRDLTKKKVLNPEPAKKEETPKYDENFSKDIFAGALGLKSS